MAQLVADLRARPSSDKRIVDAEITKEVPTRLTHQLARLAACLAVVSQRFEIDSEVLRITAKVAVDTCRGKTATMARRMWVVGDEGCSINALAVDARITTDRASTLLHFMRDLSMVDKFRIRAKEGVSYHERWKLTPRLRNLHDEVLTYA
jgi:hypothetical protein